MQSFSRRVLNRLLFGLSMIGTMIGVLAYHSPHGLSIQTIQELPSRLLWNREWQASQVSASQAEIGNPGEYEVVEGLREDSLSADEFRRANRGSADLDTKEMNDYLDYFSEMENAVTRAASLMASKLNKVSRAENRSEISKQGSGQKLSINPVENETVIIELDKSEAGKKRK